MAPGRNASNVPRGGLSDDDRTSQNSHREPSFDELNDLSENSYRATSHPLSNEASGPANDPFSIGFGLEESNVHPPSSAIARGIDLYFENCHRQPIWCFDRDELEDKGACSTELLCSILALTSRFSRDRDHLQRYGNSARNLIMLRVANGTVELETIESLCLLAYSSFIGMTQFVQMDVAD